jgi:hypothetical protein
MDKLDYVLLALAMAIQLFLSAGALYLSTLSSPETKYSVTELDTRLSTVALESGDRDAGETEKWIGLGRAALLGMDQQIKRLRSMYWNTAILGLLVLFFLTIVIVRLHVRVRSVAKA